MDFFFLPGQVDSTQKKRPKKKNWFWESVVFLFFLSPADTLTHDDYDNAAQRTHTKNAGPRTNKNREPRPPTALWLAGRADSSIWFPLAHYSSARQQSKAADRVEREESTAARVTEWDQPSWVYSSITQRAVSDAMFTAQDMRIRFRLSNFSSFLGLFRPIISIGRPLFVYNTARFLSTFCSNQSNHTTCIAGILQSFGFKWPACWLDSPTDVRYIASRRDKESPELLANERTSQELSIWKEKGGRWRHQVNAAAALLLTRLLLHLSDG